MLLLLLLFFLAFISIILFVIRSAEKCLLWFLALIYAYAKLLGIKDGIKDFQKLLKFSDLILTFYQQIIQLFLYWVLTWKRTVEFLRQAKHAFKLEALFCAARLYVFVKTASLQSYQKSQLNRPQAIELTKSNQINHIQINHNLLNKPHRPRFI